MATFVLASKQVQEYYCNICFLGVSSLNMSVWSIENYISFFN